MFDISFFNNVMLLFCCFQLNFSHAQEDGLWLLPHKAFQLIHNAALLSNSLGALWWHSQGDRFSKKNRNMEHLSYTEKCGPHEKDLLAKLTKVNLTWDNIYKQIFLTETGSISPKSKLHKQGEEEIKKPTKNGNIPNLRQYVAQVLYSQSCYSRTMCTYNVKEKEKCNIWKTHFFNKKVFLSYQCPYFSAFCGENYFLTLTHKL